MLFWLCHKIRSHSTMVMYLCTPKRLIKGHELAVSVWGPFWNAQIMRAQALSVQGPFWNSRNYFVLSKLITFLRVVPFLDTHETLHMHQPSRKFTYGKVLAMGQGKMPHHRPLKTTTCSKFHLDLNNSAILNWFIQSNSCLLSIYCKIWWG